jgi:hypothetical protein
MDRLPRGPVQWGVVLELVKVILVMALVVAFVVGALLGMVWALENWLYDFER